MNNKNIRIIAFYLPQFHPIPENDEWYGKGFTEWTNVGKAKPLFKGHYQPRVPADLGYYDLRMPEIREAQAQMAKESNIEGFCYYHYWFDKGKQLLERPFNEVLSSKKPDYPFMLCWANESWHSKFWDTDGKVDKKLIMEQKYEDNIDQIEHFNYLLKAFKDNRYIYIEDKPAFMVYKPLDTIRMSSIIKLWQKLAIENGLKGIFFIGQTTQTEEMANSILSLGFDAVNSVRHYEILNNKNIIHKVIHRIYKNINKSPYVFEYSEVLKYLANSEDSKNNIFPTILPNWDHSPRSGKGGFILKNSSPKLFKRHIEQVLNIISHKENNRKIVFIKSWNEWGEGNYLEPDIKYGHSYLNVLKEILEKKN